MIVAGKIFDGLSLETARFEKMELAQAWTSPAGTEVILVYDTCSRFIFALLVK